MRGIFRDIPKNQTQDSIYLSPASLTREDERKLKSLAQLSDWDVATRYHEWKKLNLPKEELRNLRKISVEAVYDRAKKVLGSVSRPQESKVCSLRDAEEDQKFGEVDLDTTFEHSLHLFQRDESFTPNDIWIQVQKKKRYPIVICLDTSLSMNGEKLACLPTRD